MSAHQVTLSFAQKVAAIHSLRDAGNTVVWRYDTRWAEEARWYVLADDIDISDGAIIRSAMGRGKDPEGALNDLWEQLTELEGDERVVIEDLSNRRAVRWTGFMWQPVAEPRAGAAEA